MKENKRKAQIKSVRKTIRADIKHNLIIQLKEVSAKLGNTDKKSDEEIEKVSKHMAKKLLKELNIKKATLLVADQSKFARLPLQLPAADVTVQTPPAPPKPVKKGQPKPASVS